MPYSSSQFESAKEDLHIVLNGNELESVWNEIQNSSFTDIYLQKLTTEYHKKLLQFKSEITIPDENFYFSVSIDGSEIILRGAAQTRIGFFQRDEYGNVELSVTQGISDPNFQFDNDLNVEPKTSV